MIRIILLTFVLFQSALSFSQTFWKLTSERGEQLLLAIEVDEDKNEFEAYTRRGALKDIAGTFSYFLALAAGRIQYPEIIFIDGKTSRNADSLILNGTFYYVDKKYPFKASIYGNHISGRFIDYKNKLNLISGVRVSDSRPINDYKSVISTAIYMTERYIFNPEWLNSDEWKNFSEKFNELKPFISDDYEIGVAWFWLAKDLPFSPYELTRENTFKKPAPNERKIAIREPRPKTALIDAGMLPNTLKGMDTLVQLLEKKGSTNLIIDLRGKSKIMPESVEYLCTYLTQRPFTGGIYPTRKFFSGNRSLPVVQDYPKYFRSFAEAGYKAGEFYKEQGRYFKIVPASKTFRGKLYILTDSRTSGPSSALICLLKRNKIGTIVGQGASVSSGISERIMINSDFSLSLVVSEFYTPDNRTINRSDLEPDIILRDEDALTYVLRNL